MKWKEDQHDAGKNIDFQRRQHFGRSKCTSPPDHNKEILFGHLHILKKHIVIIGRIVLFFPLEEEEQSTHTQRYKDDNKWEAFETDGSKVFDTWYDGRVTGSINELQLRELWAKIEHGQRILKEGKERCPKCVYFFFLTLHFVVECKDMFFGI